MLVTKLTAIADAIRAKTGKDGALTLADMPGEIEGIETGSSDAIEYPVEFIDYDGTVLYSFSHAEIDAMTELPPNPTNHERLVAQGWNWDLEDIKDQKPYYVGQMYTTKSGNAEFVVKVKAAGTVEFTQTLTSTLWINSLEYIDWGDGYVSQPVTTSNKKHTYSSEGTYVIQVKIKNFEAFDKYPVCLMTNSVVIEANICDGLKCAGFYYNTGLKYVSLPTTVDMFSNDCFQYAYNLRSITIPKNLSSIGDNAFGSSNEMLEKIATNCKQEFGKNAIAGTRVKRICLKIKPFTGNYSIVNTCYSLEAIKFLRGSQFSGWITGCNSLKTVDVSLVDGILATNGTQGASSGGMQITSSRNITSAEFTNSFSGTKITLSNCTALCGSYEIPMSFSEASFDGCYALEKVIFPDTFYSIGNYAFRNCYSLKSIVFPLTVESKTLGSQVFNGCNSLKEIIFPEGLETITSQYTFRYCYSLEYVRFPSTLNQLAASVFTECGTYTVFDFREVPSVPAISGSFSNMQRQKFVVPDALYNEWVSADVWSTRASLIVKASEYEG